MNKKIYLNFKDKPFLRMITVELEDMGYAIASTLSETDVSLIITENGFVSPSKNDALILVLGRENTENAKYYLKRPFDMTVFRDTVTRLASFEPTEDSVTAMDGIRLESKQKTASYGKDKISFTEAEFALLSLLYERRGETVTDAEITEKVWGKDAPDSNITAVYVNYLREKLFKICELPLIKRVRGVGYTMENR